MVHGYYFVCVNFLLDRQTQGMEGEQKNMAGESYVSKLGEVWVSCDSGKCFVVITFYDGTIYVAGEFNENDDPMRLFKGRISSPPAPEPLKS